MQQVWPMSKIATERIKKACILLVFIMVFPYCAEEPLCLSLPLRAGMSRADLYYLKPNGQELAVLVLCPGHNGNGRFYLKDSAWRNFAEQNNVGIVGLAFMSKGTDVRSKQFYYYAGNGTGKLLLDGLKKIYGVEIPILLYGFSGGAHFVSRFAEWKPERVLAWCAYSAGWWDKPVTNSFSPPGIIACGEEDERLIATRNYFWDGRELGKPWLLIELKKQEHTQSAALESFVREYFIAILKQRSRQKEQDGLWVNIYKLERADDEDKKLHPCATAWLPHHKLYAKWLALVKGEK